MKTRLLVSVIIALVPSIVSVGQATQPPAGRLDVPASPEGPRRQTGRSDGRPKEGRLAPRRV